MGAPIDPAPVGLAINDCWNRIGVRGDSSCPELVQHAHCRNCPVYADAAVTLLNRAMPAEYIADWTSHRAESEEAGKANAGSAVVFRLRSEWFALPTKLIDEIAESRPIHPVPHQRNASILGLVNVRGELVICVSLARMMGIDDGPAPSSDRGSGARERLIVVAHDSGRIAFPVDQVQRTQRFDPSDLKSVPAAIAKASSNYTIALLAWDDRVVGYLDAERIVRTVNQAVA